MSFWCFVRVCCVRILVRACEVVWSWVAGPPGGHDCVHAAVCIEARSFHENKIGHLYAGFIGALTGHEKASANSGVFDTGPITLQEKVTNIFMELL